MSSDANLDSQRQPQTATPTSERVMNPLTVNPAIAIQHARQVREAEWRASERRTVRSDRAIRAARAARTALQRAGD
jgi:hypothetical protein